MPSNHSSNNKEINPQCTSTLGPSPPTMIDSGSTGHYFSHHQALRNVHPNHWPVQVQVANQQYMKSTHTAELPIGGLPTDARIAHIFPDIHTSLLAIAPLCNNGCTVTFKTQDAPLPYQTAARSHAHATSKGYGSSQKTYPWSPAWHRTILWWSRCPSCGATWNPDMVITAVQMSNLPRDIVHWSTPNSNWYLLIPSSSNRSNVSISGWSLGASGDE